MRQMEFEKYRNEGVVCPNLDCPGHEMGNFEIEFGEIDWGIASARNECETCGCIWWDVYKLAEIDVTREGKSK